MYPGLQAQVRPQQPAFIMATSGKAVTYAELERRSNRLAHLLRASGLGRLDHYAVFMESNARYVECCSAGERAGLYYTCINSYLTPDEVAYILDNSESRILITSAAKRDIALQAMAQCPRIERCLITDGPGDGARVLNLDEATGRLPDTPIADESLAPPCFIPPARPAARRGFCGRCRKIRPDRIWPSPILLWMLGGFVTA
jgi:long-chain acyl-CoA synthetase